MWRAPSQQMSSATRKPAHHFIGTRWISKALGAFIFLRFLLAVMLLATHFVDQAFLVSKQDEAIAKLSTASSNIESLQAQAETSVNAEEDTFLDRTANQISNFLDASSQTLDLKAQLEALEAQIEDSVEEIINLIVIFLLQTLLLPVAGLWLCWWALQAFWRYPANTQR